MTERSMTLPQGRVTGSSINVAMIGSRNSSGTSYGTIQSDCAGVTRKNFDTARTKDIQDVRR